ncbi:7617_t:CDS:2 [Cetraspora pellucida]|uniref:7617_t:CDS:1 n=1 Tax=Cetraspora pellucida TaxID=1433469 RepID=A0ACA9JYE1_9GLOM|nr:7617_t:CDS:2 [Cetraspora pellucida]
MDSKLKIKINTFDTSSRNSNTSNQPEVIVIFDTDNEPLDLQIFSSFKSEYNSDNSLDNCISINNLNNNDILDDGLENKDNYKIYEYLKTSLTGIASVYNVLDWNSDDTKKIFEIFNIQYAHRDPGNI